MSQFSQLLTDHIHNKDVKVYALSQYCNVDRANMYKFINGSRTPSSFDLVLKICNFMQLSPSEKDDLIEAYQITQIGAANYYRRKQVLFFLKNFSIPNHTLPLLRPYEPPLKMQDHVTLLHSEIEINHALTGILSSELAKENGHIRLLIQPDHEFLMNVLAIGHQNSSVKVEHIICLNNTSITSTTKQNYNLHCLQKILPLYGSLYQYDCSYYYENIDSRFGKLTLFPYMILTSDFVCLLTADMQKGYVTSQPSSLQMFSDLFDQYLKKTFPLMRPMDNLFIQFQTMMELAQQEVPVHTLQLSPCLTPLLTEELLDKYIIPQLPGRAQFLQMLTSYIQQLYRSDIPLNLDSVFSMNGIRYFMEHGCLDAYPQDIYTPLCMADRISVLKKLIVSFHTYHYRILKEDICSFEHELYLVISQQNGFLCFTNPHDHRLIYLDIKEPGFIFTFLDYYEHLDSNLFFSDSEALDKLKNLLDEYSQKENA